MARDTILVSILVLNYSQTKEPKTPTRASYSSKSDQSGVSLHSAEVEKFKRELRESSSREKDLKKQIESLTKTIAELTEQIEEKEKVIRDLHLQFERQVSVILFSRFVRRSCAKVVNLFLFSLVNLALILSNATDMYRHHFLCH